MQLQSAKIITVWQPWASGLAFDLKENETRGWGTSYRGPILIHAAKRVPTVGETAHLRNHIGSLFTIDQLVEDFGCVVAAANLWACVEINQILIDLQTPDELAWGDWRPGRYAWRFKDKQALSTPIPWRGQQGLRDAPEELLEQVRRANPHLCESEDSEFVGIS